MVKDNLDLIFNDNLRFRESDWWTGYISKINLIEVDEAANIVCGLQGKEFLPDKVITVPIRNLSLQQQKRMKKELLIKYDIRYGIIKFFENTRISWY